MKADDKPRRVEVLADAQIGDVVRCDAGLVRVGPILAGGHFCRLVEPEAGDYRDASEPITMAGRTRVLEVLRDRSFYVERRDAKTAGSEVDPLRGAP